MHNLPVSMLNRQPRKLGFKAYQGRNFFMRFLLCLCHLAKSSVMSTLALHCKWEEAALFLITTWQAYLFPVKDITIIIMRSEFCIIYVVSYDLGPRAHQFSQQLHPQTALQVHLLKPLALNTKVNISLCLNVLNYNLNTLTFSCNALRSINVDTNKLIQFVWSTTTTTPQAFCAIYFNQRKALEIIMRSGISNYSSIWLKYKSNITYHQTRQPALIIINN